MVTAQKNNPIGGLLGWLQVPNSRAEISLDTIVMGAGGVLVPLGLARLFAGGPLGVLNTPPVTGAVPFFLAAVLTVAFACILLFVSQLAPLRPAGFAAAATAIAFLAESVSRIGDSPKAGFGLVLFAIFCLGLFVLPLTRHVYFLGAVLYAGWRFLVMLTSDVETGGTFVRAMDPRLGGVSNIALALSVFIAAGALGAVWFLDRSDAHGLALPFAAVGITAAGAAVVSGPNFFVSLLAFVLGGAAVWVGSLVGRRGVAWAGTAGLVLSASKLYDGFDSRFAGFVTIVVGVGLLAFAGRALLPGVAKAVNGLASNKAVLPAGAQPGQPNPPAQPFNTAPNPAQFAGPNPGPGSSPGEFAGPNPGFVQPAGTIDTTTPDVAAEFDPQTQFPQPDPSIPQGQGQEIQPIPTQEFQPPAPVEDPQAGQFLPGSFGGSVEKVEHSTEQIEAVTEPYQPQQAESTSQSEEAQVMEPNWYADPTERYDHRWHDGVNWTEHVATAGNSAVDPIS